MVYVRPGRARRRAARYALLAAFVAVPSLAIAHGTYVLDAWLEPDAPVAGEAFDLVVEIRDLSQAPVEDHDVRAVLAREGAAGRSVDLPHQGAGRYRAELALDGGRTWEIRVFDDTHFREERLTTLEVALDGGEPASRAEGVTFGLPVGGARASTVWIVTLVAVVLAAGVAVTVWVARRSPRESGRGAPPEGR